MSLNTASLSMGSGGMETLLSSTCSQLPEKPQVSPWLGRDEEGGVQPATVPSLTPSVAGRSLQRPQKVDGELGRLFPQSLGLPPTPQPASSSLLSPLQVSRDWAGWPWHCGH